MELVKEYTTARCHECNKIVAIIYTINTQDSYMRLCLDCLRKLYTLLDVNSEVNL